MLLTGTASALDLVKGSKPVSKIYVSAADLEAPKGKESLQGLVDDLNAHLQKMSGVSLEVVPVISSAAVSGPALVLGTLAAELGAKPAATKWLEGYRVVVKGDRALIAGETHQATGHAVYGLLRELGCDWVIPGKIGEIIPQRATVTISPRDQSSAPDFGVRNFWYRGGNDIVTANDRAEYMKWTRRQRLGVSPLVADNRDGHVWDLLISQNKEKFAEKPEMLALVRQPDGSLKRKGPQVETTHPAVVQLAVEYIRKTFAQRKWESDKAVTLSIGPADGGGFSLSSESMAVSPGRPDPIMGGFDTTDLVVKFANDVLEVVDSEFPNLSLGFYIYSVHADYPALHKPHPKIFPVFAPISYSRLHSTEDPHSKSRAYYNGVLKQWGELAKEQGNRYFVYEYNWNLADNMLPFTRAKMLSEEIDMYRRLGFQGFILESTKSWSLNGPADYIAARLLWDGKQDWKALLREYCQKSFGAAAPMLESYYLRLADIQSRSGQEAGSYYAAPLIFDEAYVKAAQEDLDKALAQKLSEAEKERVSAAAYPQSTLKHYLAWHQAMSAFEFDRAKVSYDAIIADHQAWKEKNAQWIAQEVPQYMKGLMQASTVEGAKYSSAPYQMVHRFPDALPTALDPTGNGHRLNFFGPEINDSGWIKTRTYGSTWDAQGLGFYREGAVWYRVHFDVVKDMEGKALGLFLGGFEDEARVWVNGKAVGSSGIKFTNPAVFDLTDGIRYGAKNVLAIQIVRNSNMNENLLGGLLRPSFVFAGPRVEVSGKKGDPEYRILPGGEREKISK